MKFTNILLLTATVVEGTEAFKLEHVDTAAATSAAHAAAAYAKHHGLDPVHAAS